MSATLLTTLCREASRAIAARFSRQFSRQSVASAGYILEIGGKQKPAAYSRADDCKSDPAEPPRYCITDDVGSARSSPSNRLTRTASRWSTPSPSLIAEWASLQPLSEFSWQCSALPVSPSLASGFPKAPPRPEFCVSQRIGR